MAQIILSSRYIKNPKKVNAGKLVKYMWNIVNKVDK